MDKIILLPLLASIALLFNRRPAEVFILVFLSSLTLLPVYFDTKLVSGIPELMFWSAALIPILAAWSFQNFERYRFYWMDVVVFLYILTIFYGQWSNSTYKEAQKILFNNMMAIFFPYIMVRSFCSDRAILIKTITFMTLLGAVVAVFNIIEFRMFVNYFDEILRKVWPRHVMWDTGMVMIRWGFKRTFGPFSHPIVSGYFFALISPISLWCYFQGHYGKNKKIGKLVVFLNILGVLVSLSRAPMVGLFLGIVIISYGWSNKKAVLGTIAVVMGTIILMVTLPKMIEYISVTRATALTVDQRNIAYRKEMWQAYMEVVAERPVLGWGRFSVPSVKGMDSIDSEYLGVALASGLVPLSFYLIFLFGMFINFYRFAATRAHDDPSGRLIWCLVAGWFTAIFTQATVYSGAQTVQYLYMLAGIGQAVMHMADELNPGLTEKIETTPIIGHGYEFIRVVA
ncbi:MAG: O-antigen ligase family protein [Desulfobacteraceae bacterium]|jgi:O-antigen ligase